MDGQACEVLFVSRRDEARQVADGKTGCNSGGGVDVARDGSVLPKEIHQARAEERPRHRPGCIRPGGRSAQHEQSPEDAHEQADHLHEFIEQRLDLWIDEQEREAGAKNAENDGHDPGCLEVSLLAFAQVQGTKEIGDHDRGGRVHAGGHG